MGPGEFQSDGLLADLAASFPRAWVALEAAVYDLLANGWDEPRRRRAHELAVALSQGARAAGWKETGGVFQAMASLLALPLGDVLSVREPLGEKLLELMELLRDSRASESA